MVRKIHLVIIDPQNDFCDLPDDELPTIADVRQRPALSVAGADADLRRMAALIDEGGDGLTDISVTLDSHQHVDIAHPTFWRQGDGGVVAPFTPITAAEVRAGRYLPRCAAALPRVLAYLDALAAAGRHTHMVWPVHCEIGSWGHNVHADLRCAYNRWEEKHGAVVAKVVKGTNPWTEHYSALRAEVPIDDDAATQLNAAFLARLRAADLVLIAGEAGSHCVKATVEDLLAYWGDGDPARLVLLADCMSPVAGFHRQYEDFLAAMCAHGVRVATAAELLPVLQANV
jgi:nicotinamidase/pyrazinamidase